MSNPSGLNYAKAGETPGWRFLEVVDLDDGTIVKDVVEVNAAEGWIIRFKRNEAGLLMSDVDQQYAKVEFMRGHFEIRRKT